ncbi:MAG: type II secretion system F family protein [Epsilonproteobacteria bacterium]|nr:type II secretion system F family protein [Campylobacterota bacterium]
MKYKITFQEDGKIKSKISSSIEDITNIISIQELESTQFEFKLLNKRNDQIVLLFYEISMMLSSKLPIKDIIEILLKSHKKGLQKEILETINKSLQDGQPIYKSLQKHEKELGYLPILFFKLGEQNGNLTMALYSLYELLSENQSITNKIKKSLQYPLILLVSFFISLSFIFIFVVPKFEYIFLEFGDKLPLSTTILLFIKNILFEYYLILLGIVCLVTFLFYFLFQKYKYFFHKIIFFSIPYFSTMYRYLIFYKFFLSISLIVKSKHKFQDALFYAKNTTTNKFIQQEITLIIKDINDGISISEAFEKREFFDEIALRMITVGENTNNLELILGDLTSINKNQLTKTIDDLSAFITPFFIFIISSFVLWLVLAIMTPVWEMGNFIK